MPTIRFSPACRPHATTMARLGFTASVSLAACIAHAAAPSYHLTRLDVPGSTNLFVNDINDAGEMVGYYTDADFNSHAFLWDATGEHDLGVPAGADVQSAAVAINNHGQIVGYAQTFDGAGSAPGLIWSTADITQYQTLSDDATLAPSPRDISDNGTVVGLLGGYMTGQALHGFVWTAEGGLVDYGTTDPSDDTESASWSAVNDAGDIVGSWNFPRESSHATVGVVGVVGMLALSEASDAVESNALAINASGQRVGYMDIDGSGNSVPVTFAADATPTAIEGATLGLLTGQALGINAAGVIVGRASNFSTLEFKAFVATDGVAYDLYQHVDATADFDYFLTARAINASGSIVGLARYGDTQVGSYVLTPVATDGVFADGFDVAPIAD